MILALTLIALTGVSFGLVGAGGAILVVPILVYAFGLSPVEATGYSFLVVLVIALGGAIVGMIQKQVAYRIVGVFAPLAMASAYLSRYYLVPLIPDLRLSPTLTLPAGTLVMFVFSTVLFLAGASMLRAVKDNKLSPSVPIVAVNAAGVGGLSGILGVGGGFLIVPVLTKRLGLAMKEAVSTSMTIVSLISLGGLGGVIASKAPLHAAVAVPIVSAAGVGLLAGIAIRGRVAGDKLKKFFGGLALTVGVCVLAVELFRLATV
ncbi:MAG TPA: sulfite exporter TauE/SafE family protein [Fimbriimonadaceae bacterium]|nr:sulfite exporter TauE/SafE family protein [Fimbriimonadaceae bacterium]